MPSLKQMTYFMTEQCRLIFKRTVISSDTELRNINFVPNTLLTHGSVDKLFGRFYRFTKIKFPLYRNGSQWNKNKKLVFFSEGK